MATTRNSSRSCFGMLRADWRQRPFAQSKLAPVLRTKGQCEIYSCLQCKSEPQLTNGVTVRPKSGALRMSETGLTAKGTDLTSKNLSTLTVQDMMVSPAYSLSPEMAATDAMAFLVEKGLSGLPVTSEDGTVLGVVSGYDLLALDCTPGKLDRSYFPPVDTCINEFGGDRKMMWSNFKQLRQKLRAASGKTVHEAMHRAFKISPDATMEEAANMVVQKRAHRICVVDGDERLVGVVSRGDIMRATIATFQAYMDSHDEEDSHSEGPR